MAIPIVPLVVATALFMENTDSTILATALPTIARDLGLDPIFAEARGYLLSRQSCRLHSRQRLGRRPRRRAHHLSPRPPSVHGRVRRLRLLEFAGGLRVLARAAGRGRSHDGAGGAHGGDPNGGQKRAGTGALLHCHAGAYRPHARGRRSAV